MRGSLLATFFGIAVATLAGFPAQAQLIDLGLPFDRLEGQQGQWVRYRIGRGGEVAQYLRLSVVGKEKKKLWIELSVSHRAALGSPGLATRLLVARGPRGALLTERTIISFNGSAPVEMLPREGAGEEETPPAFAEAKIPICREGGGRCPPGSVRYRRLPREARMSPLGSLFVSPLEITTAEGTVLRYELSERVPLTGLLAADTPQGGRLELDGSGDGARAMVGDPVKKVPQDELASALTAATPALSTLGRMGMLLDPKAREEAREASRAQATPDGADLFFAPASNAKPETGP